MDTATQRKLKEKKTSWGLLPPEQQGFLKERFKTGMTSEKMAKKLAVKGEDISVERIERIEKKLLRKIEQAENPDKRIPRE